MKADLKVGTLCAQAGEKTRGILSVPGGAAKLPTTLINGAKAGKTVLLTSGIHGGEYPGIQAAIELARELEPAALHGKVILVHPANPAAFTARVSYINPTDGKNLNRAFPGDAAGTETERLADFITREMIAQADFSCDMHGGDLHEALPPYVIYSAAGDGQTAEQARDAAKTFDVGFILRSVATGGIYGNAARRGIPGILVERGGCGLWSRAEVDAYKADILNLLRHLGLLGGEVTRRDRVDEVVENVVVRASQDGFWYPFAQPEERVSKGQKIGELRDAFGEVLDTYFADFDAMIIYIITSLAVNDGAPVISYGRFE